MEQQRTEIKAKDALPREFAGARVCQTCSLILDGATGADRCPVDQSSLMVIPQNPFGEDAVGKQYAIVSLLGSGGWGVVFKARQLSLDRFVAIKMLHEHLIAFPERMERFRREAEAVSKLNHPNIMTVYDFGILSGGQPFLVFEYIDGINLDKLLQAEKSLPLDRALPIFEQLCDGLQCAHEKNIVHRDLKPDNIRLVETASGVALVKIMDFGLAHVSQESDSAERLTRSGTTIGTPTYMSPEQCLGHPTDARTDIYSLGCVMFEVLSGKPPVSAPSLYEIMHKHVQGDIPSLSEVGVRVPAHIEQAVQRALSVDRDNRFQTAAELKQALQGGAKSVMSTDKGVFPADLPLQAKINLWKIMLAPWLIIVVCLLTVLNQRHVETSVPPAAVPASSTDKAKTAETTSANRERYLNAMLLTRIIKRTLDLRKSEITDSDVRYICDQISAKHIPVDSIFLDNNPISDQSLDYLSKLSGLWGLQFCGDHITDAGIAKLRNTGISRLHLEYTPVTGSCFSSGFERLEGLDFEGAQFDAKNLPALLQLPSLETLELGYTHIHDSDLSAFENAETPLYELSLADTDVTDKGLTHLRSLSLHALRMWGSIVRGRGLAYIKPDKLEELTISNGSDQTIHDLARFSRLQTLKIDCNNDLTPAGIDGLHAIKRLSRLLIQGSGGRDGSLNDECIAHLVRLQSLKELSIISDSATDIGVDRLKTMKLDRLTLICPEVSAVQIERLRKSMPGCTVKREH